MRGCACRGTAGVAHVSCLAEQAKILCDEVEENNLGYDAFNARWHRWDTCSLCEQSYHGVVKCALGWACWKTYLGRTEADWTRRLAMTVLGNGLYGADHHEDALPVYEAELSMKRRHNASEESLLSGLANLAVTYGMVGRHEKAVGMLRDIYSGSLRLYGEDNRRTLISASNYAASLRDHDSFEEARLLLRKTLPVARRVLGDSDRITLTMRKIYATALYEDDSSTPDDLREAATTLEEMERTARRVFGGAHPLTVDIEDNLRMARAELREAGGA